ncbi:MAG: hypothetical protein LBR22_06260 [Desulfovibrio sp.]|nr:hypothetical protein [Desulfovibrio sp.]
MQNIDTARGNVAIATTSGYFATNYHMLNELLPYFIANGVDSDTVDKFRFTVMYFLKKHYLDFLESLGQAGKISKWDCLDAVEETLDKISGHADNETFLRIILTGIFANDVNLKDLPGAPQVDSE